MPDNEYWSLFEEKDEEKEGKDEHHGEEEHHALMSVLSYQKLMTLALWLLWCYHCFFMVVILLNFLISIVSKAHIEAIDH